MSLAWGSLAIREGRVKSTRRRKSAASGAELETLDGSPRALGTLPRARSSGRGEGPRRGSGAPRTWSAPGRLAADRAPICPGPPARGRSGRGPWGFRDPRSLARGRRRGRALANTSALQSQVLSQRKRAAFPSVLGFPAAARAVPGAGGASSAPGETSPTPAPDNLLCAFAAILKWACFRWAGPASPNLPPTAWRTWTLCSASSYIGQCWAGGFGERPPFVPGEGGEGRGDLSFRGLAGNVSFGILLLAALRMGVEP